MGRRGWAVGAAMIVALACGLAWTQRFLLDDAFISLRYARNLAEGNGLVFNVGERVEGYTNLLWTLWLAVPHTLNLDPISFIYATGVVSIAVTVSTTLLLARRLIGPGPALLAGGLVATNPTFVSFATGGLETQWQALGVVACAAIAVSRPRSAWAVAGWSLLAVLTILTRMDSVILLAPMAYLLVRPSEEATHSRGSEGSGGARIGALLIPAAIVLSLWMIWRHQYYGAWLPNTFVAKSRIPGGWRVWFTHGSLCVSGWLLGYGWILGIAGALGCWRRFGHELGRAGVSVLIGPTLLWLLYVVRIGGDFMEYRLFVVITPLVAILTAWVVANAATGRQPASPGLTGHPPRSSAALLLAALFTLAAIHPWLFRHSVFSDRIESLRELKSHIGEGAPLDWLEVGQVLGEEVAGERPPVRIAVTAAGAIPYASRLETVDMLGLSDRWIAHHGAPYTDRAGHRVISPIRYLVERRVHLIVAHPVAGMPERRSGYELSDLDPYRQIYRDPESFPASATIVEMPLPGGYPEAAGKMGGSETVAMIYLTKHPRIEANLASGEWIQSPLSLH